MKSAIGGATLIASGMAPLAGTPKPQGNQQSGKFAMSENLIRQFKRDMKEVREKEIRKMIGLAPKQSQQSREHVDSLLADYVQRKGKSLRLRAVYKGQAFRALDRKSVV